MGCLKLSYCSDVALPKVMYGKSVLSKKSAQIWLSVDPMSDKYPSLTPYNYCANNPVILVDPDGRTVVIPGQDDAAFVNNLIDPNSKDYSPEFHAKYNELDISNHTYTFESWEYDAKREEDGAFENIDENNSTIHFTKDDNPQVKDNVIGASRYRVLFEETFHAAQFDKKRTIDRTCVSEAQAWKFSATAPGTKYSYYDFKTGSFNNTLMGRFKNSSISSIALGFKIGMPQTKEYPGIGGEQGLYHDFKLGTKDELKLFPPGLERVIK